MKSSHSRNSMIIFVVCLSPIFMQSLLAQKDIKKDYFKSDEIEIPKGASDIEKSTTFNEITFLSGDSIAKIGKFYIDFFGKSGWKTEDKIDDDEWDDLEFKKGDNSIEVEMILDEETKKVEVTIEGDGIVWNEKEEKRMNSAGIDTDKVPLLDNQSRSTDGSMELLQFNSRKPVKENIDHYKEWMDSKGWKLSETKEQNGAKLYRFEKDKMFIKLGLWTHKFSDNRGDYVGTGGAMTGTGLFWSGRQGVEDVAGKQADEAEKFLDLSVDKKKKLKEVLQLKIDRLMTGQEGEHRQN